MTTAHCTSSQRMATFNRPGYENLKKVGICLYLCFGQLFSKYDSQFNVNVCARVCVCVCVRTFVCSGALQQGPQAEVPSVFLGGRPVAVLSTGSEAGHGVQGVRT